MDRISGHFRQGSKTWTKHVHVTNKKKTGQMCYCGGKHFPAGRICYCCGKHFQIKNISPTKQYNNMCPSGVHASESLRMLWSVCTVLRFSSCDFEDVEALMKISVCSESGLMISSLTDDDSIVG